VKQTGRVKRVTARAYANIALCKYWGKQPGGDNAPATPSLSLALDKLATTTTVTRRGRGDCVVINGRKASRAARDRITGFIDLWRGRGLVHGHFNVESNNEYPTAGGLASSAGGFATLAVALNGFCAKPLSTAALSRIARRGSGSAARSITGGLSVLPTGADPAARLLMPAQDISWRMVLAVMDAPPKSVSSREGMELSRVTSPYYEAWLKQAAADYRRMCKLIPGLDLAKAGPLAEANMLAMHACIQATRQAPLYWTPATVAVLDQLRRWRRGGLCAWATIDAGPHVAVLCDVKDAKSVAGRLRRLTRSTAGIDRVVLCQPAGPAEILETEQE